MIEPPKIFNIMNIVIIMYKEETPSYLVNTIVWQPVPYPVVLYKIFRIHEEELIEQIYKKTIY